MGDEDDDVGDDDDDDISDMVGDGADEYINELFAVEATPLLFLIIVKCGCPFN